MPPLENTDRDSSPTSPPVALVAKPKFKPENTSSWNVIDMTPPRNHATSSSIALSTFLQITPKHLALTTDKVPSRRGSPEQKCSLRHLVFFISHPLPWFSTFYSLLYFFAFPFYLSRYCVLTTACLRALCNKLMIFFKKKKSISGEMSSLAAPWLAQVEYENWEWLVWGSIRWVVVVRGHLHFHP